MKVVDASVAVKWFLTEPGSEQALELLESCDQLSAPSIIRVEVLGAISRHYREGKLTEGKARAACDAWKRLLAGTHLRLIPTGAILDRALQLSFECRHALPDCLYLAVAGQLGTQLLTADETLHRRAGRTKMKVMLFATGRHG